MECAALSWQEIGMTANSEIITQLTGDQTAANSEVIILTLWFETGPRTWWRHRLQGAGAG